jgi:hypothetical protein
VSLGANQLNDVRRSTGAYLRAQRFLTQTFGLAGTVTYAQQRSLPSRAGLQLSLVTRW